MAAIKGRHFFTLRATKEYTIQAFTEKRKKLDDGKYSTTQIVNVFE